MNMADNLDANDVETLIGLEKVREAFSQRKSMLPPFAPAEAYSDEFEGAAGPDPVALKATPFQWRDPASIPPRKWLYGRHLIRKFVSLDIAPGGLGKSSVKIVEALAMASGIPLLGKDLHEGPLRVWLYNLEDPAEESERRIHAAAQHYALTPDQFGDRLFADSGREQPMCIAEETDGGAKIVRPVSDAVIAELKARKIDVLSLPTPSVRTTTGRSTWWPRNGHGLPTSATAPSTWCTTSARVTVPR